MAPYKNESICLQFFFSVANTSCDVMMILVLVMNETSFHSNTSLKFRWPGAHGIISELKKSFTTFSVMFKDKGFLLLLEDQISLKDIMFREICTQNGNM